MNNTGVTIYNDECYKIISYFNGGAYDILELKSNKNVFLQIGDDSIAFRENFNNCQNVEQVYNTCSQYFY